MEAIKISRASLGHFAKLGHLYDARKDEFLSINALKNRPKEDDIDEVEANSVDIDFILTDSLKEKFEKLDINADLSLSIMSGLVKLQGSASYLQDQKSSSRSARMTLTYSVRTKHQEINLIGGIVDPNCLETTYATHIVVGIDWGAKCNITCEYEKSENEDDMEVKGKLRAEIEKMKGMLSLEGGASVDFSQKGTEKGTKFSYRSKCDVSDLSKDIPSTFEAAMSVATTLPSVVQKTNSGKGIPLTYHLLSLNVVRNLCKIERKFDVICRQVEEDAIKRCTHILEKVYDTHQKLDCLVKDLNEAPDAICPDVLNKVQDLQNQFEINEAMFKSKLKQALVKVRSGVVDVSEIYNAQTPYLQQNLSAAKINKEIRDFDMALGKLQLINNFRARGVLYIGNRKGYELVLQDYATKKVYLWYMDYSFKSSKPDVWRKQRDRFFSLVLAHVHKKDYNLIIVDCEFQPEVKTEDIMLVKFLVEGKFCCEDVSAQEPDDLPNCTIKMDDVVQPRRKPNRRVLLEIRCPNSFQGECSSERKKWFCWSCKDVIEYGIDDKYFYCKCGGGKCSNAVYQCADVKHGLSFVPYEKTILEPLLNEFWTMKQINIVIIGETGICKSTWINALANYLAFPSLQEAVEANDMRMLLPSQFSYISETGDMKDITAGKEFAKEVPKTGQSVTEAPKTYKFYVGNHEVSLIDIPFIGDGKGLEQDEKNIEIILRYLSDYKEINAICILLKPDDSRFRFCNTGFFTLLHKSAAENIIFCFTDPKTTFYRPGEALPTSMSLISEHKDVVVNVTPYNQFCFDNDAFRFVACMKSGVMFSQQEIDAYSSSWDRAVSETECLLKHITGLKPHSMQQTITLNNARRIISENSMSLAELLRKNEVISEAKPYEVVKKLQDDQREILNVCAQFCCFLDKNAIMPFNDVFDSHLQTLINGQNQKPSIINELRKKRQEYELQKMTIYDAMENPNESDVTFIRGPNEIKEQELRMTHLMRYLDSLDRLISSFFYAIAKN